MRSAQMGTGYVLFVCCVNFPLIYPSRQHGPWLHSRWCCKGVSVWNMWSTCRPCHWPASWTGTEHQQWITTFRNTRQQSQSCIACAQCKKKLTTNVRNWLFQSLPQRDFVVLAARTPERGDSTSAAGGSLDKEWVTEHARQVDNRFSNTHSSVLSLLQHTFPPKVLKEWCLYFCWKLETFCVWHEK